MNGQDIGLVSGIAQETVNTAIENLVVGQVDLTSYEKTIDVDTKLNTKASKNGNIAENFSSNNITVQGNILPTTNGTQSIGSPTNRFKEIYVDEAKLSVNTLYLGDTAVMGTNQDTIVIKGDKDQSIAMKTTGVGTTKMISENGVELSTSGMNANVNVQATGSGANANLSATNQVNLISPNINIQGTSTDVKGAMTVDNLTIRGNITINGGATTIQSTTVQVEDNIIELNKGEVGYGVTSGRSGLKIDRGDADDYLIIFDETDDSLKIGTDSILQKVSTQNYVDTKDALKADKVHSHNISDVSGLQTDLDSKLTVDDLVAGSNINFTKVGNTVTINSTATGGSGGTLIDDSNISTSTTYSSNKINSNYVSKVIGKQLSTEDYTTVEKTKLDNITGINTGDETQATIKTKLGSASSTTDGYLTSTDFTTFNNKSPQIKPTNYLYVGKNGNDSTGDGSVGKPFLTVQSAINNATSGTTIFIFPATYLENLTFKAGVYLTASVKYGVYITGNHIADYSGTCIVENIVLNSGSGITLSFQGTNAQNLQLLGCSVDSTNGHAISWTNTNALSKIYSEDSITSVSASSSTAKCFYAPSTAKGSVISNRYSFKVNNPDNIALDIGGSLSFTHTGDQIIGQVLVNNSASTTFASLSNTTFTTPVLTTNSTGMTTMINTVINTTSNPTISGAGAFSYVAILYANTGVGGASSLNGGLGAIALPMSSLKLRNSSLIPSGQISAGLNSGSFEFTGSDLYFTKGTSRDKIAMVGDIPSIINKLESTNIKAGSNITITSNGNDITINSTGLSTYSEFVI